jgi:hypothetical protein
VGRISSPFEITMMARRRSCGSVPPLHPEAETVQEMLKGWRNQQLCRNLDHQTIADRIRLVERFLERADEFTVVTSQDTTAAR